MHETVPLANAAGDADLRIGDSDVADAPAILALQRLCYRREAERYDDWSLAPLTETLSDLIAAYDRQQILAAWAGSRLVGSVRAQPAGGVVAIGRLVVHPACERHGLGTALMAAIERRFPPPVCFELFTGHRSEGNLRLYHRLGYVEHRRETASADLDLVFLRKRIA